MGLTPAQPLVNLYKGDRLLRAYLGKLDDPDMTAIVDSLLSAGGRVKMDEFYRNAAVDAFTQALRKGNYVVAGRKLLPSVLDAINKPIFEYLVPRQKLGVFFDMARDALNREPDMSLERKREVMGKLWDSVDNRMGELVYDKLFWSRALKDALMVSVRCVGWNLGTFRELGGGVADFAKIPKEKGLTDRSAYLIALPFTVAVLGAVIGYLFRGEPPEDLKDCLFPRTGRLRPDGSEDRLSLPSYIKDIYEYGHDIESFIKYGEDPTRTLRNKLHPLLGTTSQMLTNEDFFGAKIRNPGDSAVLQAEDEAKYLMKQLEPFSVRNYLQQANAAEQEPSVAGYLTSPSMYGITPAPGYMTKSEEDLESMEVSRQRAGLIKKFRNEIRENGVQEDTVSRMKDAGLNQSEIKYVIKSGNNPEHHGKARSFKY